MSESDRFENIIFSCKKQIFSPREMEELDRLSLGAIKLLQHLALQPVVWIKEHGDVAWSVNGSGNRHTIATESTKGKFI